VAAHHVLEGAALRAVKRQELTEDSAYARANAQRLATGKPIPRSKERRPAPSHGTPGVIHRSDYLSVEDESQLLTLDEHGMPTGYLDRRGDRLVVIPDGKARAMVNPKSTQLYRLGLYSFNVRGTNYYGAAVKSADLRPGKPVRLVREPDNEHDPNAIAIYAANVRSRIGFVNKQRAARLAKSLDAGEHFTAVSTRGDGPGKDEHTPMILAARSDVLAHLMRKL
jgi:hypothetical protein